MKSFTRRCASRVKTLEVRILRRLGIVDCCQAYFVDDHGWSAFQKCYKRTGPGEKYCSEHSDMKLIKRVID